MNRSIKRTYHFLNNHPLSQHNKILIFYRFFFWQLQSRINKGLIVKEWIQPLKLYLKRNLVGATGNYYVGLHDFEEMLFLLHFLKMKDVFFDIGSNVGCYSLLASGICQAQSYAFEPIPESFQLLNKNVEINQLQKHINTYNLGLGDVPGELNFTKNLDTVNHVVISPGDGQKIISVPVRRLDDLAFDSPKLIKIDVEGFEYFVLRGADKILSDSNLQGIIIELNGSGGRYGISDEQVHKLLIDYHFLPVTYNPINRVINRLETYNSNGNTIYLRNLEDIQQKMVQSPKVNIYGRLI